jgi:hypothetical protein
MCTSFISRKEDTIIGMNFDNNGMKFAIDNKKPNWFTVLVDGGRGKYPSFGVDSDGRFFNNIVVDSNGKGMYRRPSKKVTHTTKLVSDILSGAVLLENLNKYLAEIEVVNIPDWSCHNMICDSAANVWIIEPGRGNVSSPADESPFFVMTNFSIWDMLYKGAKHDCQRYQIASNTLLNSNEIDVEKAFYILESVKQTKGDWITAFSMVYSKKNRAVYYCLNGNFNDRLEYKFLE